MKITFISFIAFFLFTTGLPAQGASPYQGTLYDAHAHLSGRSNMKRTIKDFREAGFERVALFTKHRGTASLKKAGGNMFLFFVDPFKRQTSKDKSGKKTSRYIFKDKWLSQITSSLINGEVAGFGEIYFRLGWAPFAENGIRTDITSNGAKKLLGIAKRFNVPVQIHLDSEHADILEDLLTSNPEIQFVLAHCGFFKPNDLGKLMDKHANLNAEVSLIFNPFISKFANLPLNGSELKDDWRDFLTRHAGRLMIGTDYTADRSEQLPKLASYYRKVLGLLPKDVADKIAHGTFEKLFYRN